MEKHSLPEHNGYKNPLHDTALILVVDACVKKIFRLGRRFPWPRPQSCPRCGGRVWGHGFTPGYFDGFNDPLWLRRYRCPDCRAIIKVRPTGYWPRFQATIYAIRRSISHRFTHHKWLPELPRSRQGHWLRGLKKQVFFHFGASWQGKLLEAFDALTSRGLIAVSRSI
jgi:DNA-directed RNA polymerase subunit RPC12/RpoP